MPAAVVILVHVTITGDINDLIGLHILGKHGFHIGMATDAIRVAVVVVSVGWDRGIDEVVLVIIHVHFVDTRHGIDYIECILQVAFIVLEHRTVQGSFNNGTDIVSALTDDRVQVFFIDRPENDTERYE